MIKKIFSDSVIYGLAPQIPRLASFLILPFITPFLSESDYGIFGIVTSYVAMLAALKDLGLRVVLSNTFFKHNNHIVKIWGQIYGFLYIWNFAFSLLVGLVLYFIIPKEAVENRWLIIILNIFPIVFFGQTSSLGQLLYQLKKKPFQVGIRAAIIGSLAVVLNYYTIAILKLGYLGFFWSTFFSITIANLSYWLPLNFRERVKPIFCFKWRFIRDCLKIGLPVVPHNIAGYFQSSSDRIVMERLNVSTPEIGSYSFAANFGNLYSSVNTAINTAVNPYMLEYYKNEEDLKARNIVFLWQVFILFICFISCIWLKEIFQLLIKNDSLATLYPITIILIMAQAYRPMSAGSLKKLFFLNKTNQLFKVTLTAGIVNVVANLIFIPIYGYVFAVFSTYFTYLLQGYIFYVFKSFKEANSVKFYPLIWISLQIGLSIIVYFMRDIVIYQKLVISLVVLVLASLALFKISKKL